MNRITLWYKSGKKKKRKEKRNIGDPLLQMHRYKLMKTGCYVGGNTVNIYSPFQSWAPGMKSLGWTAEREINPENEQGPVVSFMETMPSILRSFDYHECFLKTLFVLSSIFPSRFLLFQLCHMAVSRSTSYSEYCRQDKSTQMSTCIIWGARRKTKVYFKLHL